MDTLKDFLLQLTLISTLIFTFHIYISGRTVGKKHEKLMLSLLLGVSLLLCMSFPVEVASDYRVDIRIVPLLLGTLYGGWGTGLFLSALIVLFRLYKGIDLGLYTSVLTLVVSMPVLLFARKAFAQAGKWERIRMAMILLLFYSAAGMTSVTIVRGISFPAAFQIHAIHIAVNTAAVLFFTFVNEAIREMIEKNRRLQAEAKDAEIAFLRSQIKPHFLYNTLNSIAVLCMKEPRRAEELTLEFSQYLRRSFDFKQLDSFSTIENELELVKAYLNIEKVRFGAKLEVEYDVDADLDFRLPPLILQPLVENAVRHGLMSNLRGGAVRISIRKTSPEEILLSVDDNGCGIDEARLAEIAKPGSDKQGVGLWNIAQRLQLLYGTGMHFTSKVGVGTTVRFAIPAQRVDRGEGATDAGDDRG